MPTTFDDPPAASAARVEAAQWVEVATAWAPELHPDVWEDLPASEAAVVGHFDPRSDLEQRARSWDYELGEADLADLARFAAALSVAEADAWRDDKGHIATRAYADRRMLLGDRILHWAVPWLDAVGRCHPRERAAHHARDLLLRLGDHHRPAPGLVTGREGLHPPGEDAYGPVAPALPLPDLLGSVWSGGVLLGATVRAMTADPNRTREVRQSDLAAGGIAGDLALLHEVLAARWRSVAAQHPGSERLWLDLAERADTTSRRLRAGR